jgi:tRNA(Ile)-lysidine synthase
MSKESSDVRRALITNESATGRLDPAVARIRRAVREALVDVLPGARLLVACSGGADSMALAAAATFEGTKAGWQVGAIVVDHGLQADSAEVAAAVAGRLRTLEPYLGMEPIEVVRVHVEGKGGPEAAARRARYRALSAAAARHDAVVLLGHTRDDQAETVLLGLVRGSGLRSISGMRAASGAFRRPLLGVGRADTARACAALAIPVWQDPHNDDSRFLRTRVRRQVLPILEDELGPGVAEALARTAELARQDADALDAVAEELGERARLAWPEAAAATDADPGANAAQRLRAEVLAAAPAALRHRVLRNAALAAGAPAGELFARHVRAVDELITHWHGQLEVDLPGHLVAQRRDGVVVFRPRAH